MHALSLSGSGQRLLPRISFQPLCIDSFTCMGAGEHFERETKLRKRVVLFDSFMTFNGHNQYIPRSIAGKQFHVPCNGRLILQLTIVLFIQGKSLLYLSISSVW